MTFDFMAIRRAELGGYQLLLDGAIEEEAPDALPLFRSMLRRLKMDPDLAPAPTAGMVSAEVYNQVCAERDAALAERDAAISDCNEARAERKKEKRVLLDCLHAVLTNQSKGAIT